MDKEKIDYLFAVFEMYLLNGYTGKTAWALACDDFAYVFFVEDGRTNFQRAAERGLKIFEETAHGS